MDTSCANHPESMALATCKACEKSVCLMCVVDEKEGVFCSSTCHSALVNGQEVPKFAGVATEAAATGGAQKIDSIFDDGPSANLNLPPSSEPEPIVSEGTKWRPIGAQCENHTDTPAVATCDRCAKTVCALCLLEASQGTFCSADCMGQIASQPKSQPAPAEKAALEGRPVWRIKETPRRSKNGPKIVVAAALLAVALGGGYVAFTLMKPAPASIDTSYTPPPLDPVGVSGNPKKDPDKTDPRKPDIQKPDVTVPPKDPKKDPVKPDVEKPGDPVAPPPSDLPRRPKPARPPPALPTRIATPWSTEEPGSWFRMRTLKDGKVSYVDTGLKSKTPRSAVLFTQTSSGGQTAAPVESTVEATLFYIQGEESIRMDDRSWLCEIRSLSPEPDAPKVWTILQGGSAGAALKGATPDGVLATQRVWEHTMRVKNRPFDCLVLESVYEAGGAKKPVKTWYSRSFPLGIIQRETPGESVELVDFGSDWTKRTPFPNN